VLGKIVGVELGMTNRVAVLVDGDNISASFADHILRCGQRLGRVDVARVYAGAGNPSQWLSMAGFRYFHAGAGKNAADLLLTIDAMEMAFGPRPDAFVIASSDSDFTHLALRLRERGHHVCGIGEAKAQQAFRIACTEFVELRAAPVLAPKASVPPAVTAAKHPAFTAFDQAVLAAIKLYGGGGKGLTISKLNELAYKKGTTLASLSGKSTWRSYFKGHPDLYELTGKGHGTSVRLKSTTLAAAA
jgi:NYN domain